MLSRPRVFVLFGFVGRRRIRFARRLGMIISSSGRQPTSLILTRRLELPWLIGSRSLDRIAFDSERDGFDHSTAPYTFPLARDYGTSPRVIQGEMWE